jgi:transposase InsO family protein
MAKSGMAKGMPVDLSVSPATCEHCILGKQVKTPVPRMREGERAKAPLAIVYSDLTGPEDVVSAGGALYLMNIIDDYSSYPWGFTLKRKSDAVQVFKDWKARVERETGYKLGIIRTDGGGEFSGSEYESTLQREGVEHQTTAPYTSAHNGRSERLHRTIMGRVRAMRLDAKLPPKLWGECAIAAFYLAQRTPTRTLKGKTPYEALFGKKPRLSHLREYGCKAFVLIQNRTNPKIYPRSEECVLVGYSNHSKAYRCWNPQTGRILTSYNVTFIESQDCVPRTHHPRQNEHGVDVNIDSSAKGTHNATEAEDDISDADDTETEADQYEIRENTPDLRPEQPRRSGRQVRVSAAGAAMQGIQHTSRLDQVREEVRTSAMRTKTHKGKAQAPATEPNMDPNGTLDNALATLVNNDTRDPKNWAEAMKSNDRLKWMAGMEKEMNSIKNREVWKLVPPTAVPRGRNIIGCRPVCHVKRDAKGQEREHKVRLVAQGFTQVAGMDYTDTFAPVARMESMRSILHIGAQRNWLLRQFDVKTAFLYGELEEEIYMRQPKGYEEKGKEDHIALLQKGLYGLKQGGRQWNKKLHTAMTGFSYQRVAVDHCIYTRTTDKGTSFVAIHVDDMLASASSEQEMDTLKEDLQSVFEIKDLGDVHWLLGVAITRDRQKHTVSLSQAAYVDTIISRFKMEKAYPVSTPLEPGTRLSISMSPTTEKEKAKMAKKPYQMIIGSLMYAAITTRPDIIFAVQQLSQFSSNPGRQHWRAAKRVVRYLKGTRDYSLVLGGKENIRLTGYTDADWANDPDRRRSISGYLFTLGGGVISWSSRKQQTVATSSCEAEYMAASHCTKEALWLRNLLKQLDMAQTNPTKLYCDNEGAISLTKDASFHSRSKHIDVAHHFVRERVDANQITFEHVPTHRMPADALTKALARPKFVEFRDIMGVRGKTLTDR